MNFGANGIFGLRQSRKAQSAHLLLDVFYPIGTASPRIGYDIIDRFASQYRVYARSIAQGGFFKPVHQIAQVILADLERDNEPCQRARVVRLPAKPALQRLRMKAFRLRIIANFLLRHDAPE